MNLRRAAVLATITVAAAVLCLSPAGWRATGAQEPPQRPGKHFLEVGKSYTLLFPNGNGAGPFKVLEAPQDGWVKTAVGKGPNPQTMWFNLSTCSSISPVSGGG